MPATDPHAAAEPRSGDHAPLPAGLRLGPVHLTVADVDRSVAWYQRSLGLRVHSNEPDGAALGDGAEAVIVLHEDPQARPAGRHAGLYHYALLYPSRIELARGAVRLRETHTAIQGASDHGTHEAIYLPDPDGIGIELAADRAREHWPSFEEEFARGGPRPLQFADLLVTVDGEALPAAVGAGLRIGHVHLHVGGIAAALGFYRDVLGFEQQALLPTAAFVSAGGYHHHLGLNVWKGEGVGPEPPHTAGLDHWTVQLPAVADVETVLARVERAGLAVSSDTGAFELADPWGIRLRFEPAAAAA